MDNRIINIQSEGQSSFNMAMNLLIEGSPGKRMEAFAVLPSLEERCTHNPSRTNVQGKSSNTLVLFWSRPSNSVWTPFVQNLRLKLRGIQEYAWEWLVAQDEKREEYLGDNVFDGSLGKEGFKAFCEEWGHVGEERRAFAAIRPMWAWYGK